MKVVKVILSVASAVFCAVAGAPARADQVQTTIQTHLTIVPTFASSITGDANAAQIESAINSAISIYAADFSNPITVNVTFQEGVELGSSTWTPVTETYTSFYNALQASATSVDDATALTRLALDGSLTDPVPNINSSTSVNMKPANVCVLQIGFSRQSPCTTVFGGTISLNTSLTSPGGAILPNAFNLAPVVEHEMDEILGLGSTLGVAGLNQSNPSPEDFFRFTAGGANGTRSFISSNTPGVYFSLDGTTALHLFDNQADGGDYGDWQSNPLPDAVAAQVQDAFGTQNVNPSLGVELQALDAIGYTRAAPEPGTLFLMGGGLLLAGLARLRHSR